MLITPEYRALNAKLHQRAPLYGTSGHKHAEQVRQLAQALGAPRKNVTVLDYGCGKGTLGAALHFSDRGFYLFEYDPAIPGKDTPPEPADLVVCGDVLEHIEPECLDAVLDDLQRLTKRFVLLTVATRAAQRTLPDGRNTHLIVEDADWWLPKLLARWRLKSFGDQPGEFQMIGEWRA
jgi:hypothetical protein